MTGYPELELRLRFTPTYDYSGKERIDRISGCVMVNDEILYCVRSKPDKFSDLSCYLLGLFLKKYVGCEDGDYQREADR